MRQYGRATHAVATSSAAINPYEEMFYIGWGAVFEYKMFSISEAGTPGPSPPGLVSNTALQLGHWGLVPQVSCGNTALQITAVATSSAVHSSSAHCYSLAPAAR